MTSSSDKPPQAGYEQRKAFFDRTMTVYGRKAVLEALEDPALSIHALHLADSNRQDKTIRDIESAAESRGIAVNRHTRQALSRISRNGRQDQGVAAGIHRKKALNPIEEAANA